MSLEGSRRDALDESARRTLDGELETQGEINTGEALCVLTERRGGVYRFLLFDTEGFDRAHYLLILENTPRRVCGLNAEIAVTPFQSLPQFLLFRRFARELAAREQLMQEGNPHAAQERLRAFIQSLSAEEAVAFARHLRQQEGLAVDGETGEDCLNALENRRSQSSSEGGGSLAVKARRLIAERYADPLLSLSQVADAELSDRLSTGLWTRKLIGKLFSGSSDYIAYVRLDMNGYNALLILRIHALSRLPLNALHYCVYIQ